MTLSILDSFKLLLFLTVLTGHQVASQEEEKEVSPRSNFCRAVFNKPGACVSLQECEPLLRLLNYAPFLARRVIWHSVCGRTSRRRLVCCPGVRSSESSSGNNNSNNNNKNSNNNSNNNNNNGNKNSNNAGNTSGGGPKKVQPLRPPQCGSSKKAHNRVVGGTPAELGAWPWIANVGYMEDNQVGFGCGGSLISSRHVITAGHCVYGELDKQFVVRLGEYDLSNDNDGANPLDYLVEKVTLHPRYNHKIYENDIAILKLKQEVQFTDAVHPICLPVEDDIRNRNFVNNYPFAAGWGKTSNDKSDFGSDILRETQLPVVDLTTCKNDYRDVVNAIIDDRVICAGYAQGGKDVCQGDSGGPLMFPLKESFYLIGVVSAGYKCAEPGFPGVYTRVTSFLDFILSNMN